MQAKREQNRLVTLPAQICHRKIPPQTHVQPQLWTQIENLSDLCLQDIARQTIFGNSQVHHAARHRGAVKDRNRVAQQREIMRSGHAGRSGANNRDFLSVDDMRLFRKHIDCVSGLGAVALREKTLQRTDRNGRVQLPTAASWFARMAANSAANRSEGIGDASVAVRFLVPPLRNR